MKGCVHEYTLGLSKISFMLIWVLGTFATLLVNSNFRLFGCIAAYTEVK